jgi:hypothetical protein
MTFEGAKSDRFFPPRWYRRSFTGCSPPGRCGARRTKAARPASSGGFPTNTLDYRPDLHPVGVRAILEAAEH